MGVEPWGDTLGIRGAHVENWRIFPICKPLERDAANATEPMGEELH
jgi:hypothetical protein